MDAVLNTRRGTARATPYLPANALPRIANEERVLVIVGAIRVAAALAVRVGPAGGSTGATGGADTPKRPAPEARPRAIHATGPGGLDGHG